MTTYKQLKDSWIRSEWVNAGAEDFGEDALVIIPAGLVSVTLEDLIKKRIKKKNYQDIVKLADYIMVENVDLVIDEIVRVTRKVNVVYEFEDFYRLSERLKPLTSRFCHYFSRFVFTNQQKFLWIEFSVFISNISFDVVFFDHIRNPVFCDASGSQSCITVVISGDDCCIITTPQRMHFRLIVQY